MDVANLRSVVDYQLSRTLIGDMTMHSWLTWYQKWAGPIPSWTLGRSLKSGVN